MSRIRNPFRASLGANPPLLVGRDEILNDFSEALEEGPGAHERISLIVGARGVGKTVLLNEMEAEAKSRGWIVLSETATRGFTERLRHQLLEFASSQTPSSGSHKLSLGPSFAQIQLEKAAPQRPQPTLRSAFYQVFDHLDAHTRFNEEPTGILVTIDELHYNHVDEITEFAATIQHLVREDRQIAVAIAGIPSSIRPLLSDDDGRSPITFLRRANRIDLGKVSLPEVREGLAVPSERIGVQWEESALELAVEGSGGYPFMIQLIGHWALRAADGKIVSDSVARSGLAKAKKKLGQLVHEPALSDLSAEDRRFLAAMSLDAEPSKVADVAERLGVSLQQAYNYRKRLVDADMVTADRGYAQFALPYVGDYLREHVVSELLNANQESTSFR